MVDALFTSTSAVCVTGLVVVDTGTYFSLFGQIIIMILIQIGGLGFMTFSTLFALILGKRISLRERLIMKEAMNQVSMSGLVRLTKYVIIFTFAIEALAACLLSFRFVPQFGPVKGIYFSIFHSISAYCNAGFDIFGHFSSLTDYTSDILVNVVIMSLFIIGGLGFSILADFYNRRNLRKLSFHTKTVLLMTTLLIAVGSILIFIMEFNNPETLGGLGWKGKILGAVFQGVTPRTAGFSTINTGAMTKASLFFTCILMFIGASPGSTGGGIKTTTFMTLILTVSANLKGNQEPTLFSRRIPRDIVYKTITIITISMLLIIVMVMVLSATEQVDFINIFFEVISAFGTVGLSTGITPYLSVIGRLALVVTMFAGRVGPLTLALAISMRQKKASYSYPEERLIVG